MARVEEAVAFTLVDRLSPRQRDVLHLVARGLTNPEIGNVLEISGETVRTHVAALISRLEVSNRTEAAAAYLSWDASAERVAQLLARPAIAVLPLLSLDVDPRAVTIAAGFTRDLVTLFSRWCWFPVIANASTKDARTLGATSQEIGERLGARFLVDAALRSAGQDFRISVCIADAMDGRCIFADTYDFPSSALFKMQDEICQRIVAAAYPQLAATVQAGLSRRRRHADLDAWEQTHQALIYHAARERDMNRRAQDGFAAALRREPTLVLAHYGLGLASYDELLNQWGPQQPALDRIAACAERCINLSPHAAEGHFLIGRHLQAIGEHIRAVKPLTTAISHNPSFAAAHALLSQVLLIAGRNDEGLLRMQHACRLGPRAFVAGLAAAHFIRHDFCEALKAAEDALSTNPRYPFARALAAASAFWMDDFARAAAHYQSLLSTQPGFSFADFSSTFGANIDAVALISQALEAISLRS